MTLATGTIHFRQIAETTGRPVGSSRIAGSRVPSVAVLATDACQAVNVIGKALFGNKEPLLVRPPIAGVAVTREATDLVRRTWGDLRRLSHQLPTGDRPQHQHQKPWKCYHSSNYSALGAGQKTTIRSYIAGRGEDHSH